MLPDFDARGHLPPGRYRVDIETAGAALVGAERFEGSKTRDKLWTGFEEYAFSFVLLEQRYSHLLDGASLIHSVWLGGSFVSSKLDPENVDATVLVDEAAEKAVRGQPGSTWLTDAFKSRRSILQKFGVSALRIGYRPVASVFDVRTMSAEEQTYFRDRGRWDDWWQRCRLPDIPEEPPSEASAVPVRGYLEVTL
jgi:hypothetical protein